MGNLYDFDPVKDLVPFNELEELDRLTLHKLSRLTERVLEAYKTFEFHVIYHSVHNFCSVDLSAFYLDVIKDRLYTCGADSRGRRAAQTAIYHVLDHLVRLTAPILVFTSDEAWSFMPGKKTESVHLASMPVANPAWIDDKLEEKWDELARVKTDISKALEGARQTKLIGHPLDAEVVVYPKKDEALMKEEARALEEVLIISRLTIASGAADTAGETAHLYSTDIADFVVRKAPGGKCERCWHYSPHVGKSAAHPALSTDARRRSDKNLRVLVITALAVLVIDQISKLAVIHYFGEGESVEIIAGFFDLVHFRNPGAAFGIFNEGGVARRVFLIATSGAALAVIFFLLKETKDSLVTLGLSLVAGGAAGNLVDRVRFGSVVDFLYFHAGPYYWPAFNIADSAITTGVILSAVFHYFRRP